MICAIVLAAGRSTRMGAQKLLLPFAGKTVIAHIVDELLTSRVQSVVVVVGADAERVTSALADRKVTFVRNPDPAGEMLSSVRCGIAALPAASHGALIALGDQPSISHEVVDQLIAEFEAADRGIVVPTHDNHRGHPMIISARYRDEIMSRHEEAGLLGLLDEHADDVLRVPISSRSVLDDMDYPEDYRRKLERLSGPIWPKG